MHNVSFGTFERNGQTYTFSQQLDTNGNSTYRFVDGDGNPRGSVVCNVGESCTGDNPDAVNLAEDIQATAPYMIFVTEPVPGASCTCTAEGGCDGAVSNRLYTCVVVPGVGGFLQMIQ